jgi:ribonuclease Y
MNIEIPWLLPSLYWIIGVAFGYVFQSLLARMKQHDAQRSARVILEDAQRERANILREAGIEARNEVLKAREEFEKDTWARRQELAAIEERATQREMNVDRKLAALDQREQGLDRRQNELQRDREALQGRQAELQELLDEEQRKLAALAGLSPDQARAELMAKLAEGLRAESTALVHRVQEETTQSAEREARKIIATAVERYAADQVSEMTTSAIRLPNDEMKARIIGKEGRNIRALEAATGVNVLIDDTPEVVVLSSFDPIRREVARQAMERLIQDGRIHPGRIEEVVAKVQSELEETVRTVGEAAVYELGLTNVDPEVATAVGRLKFRHSYGQNVLRHSMEMAHLMGAMAGEMNLDPLVARRIGLFHDIGKAMDQSLDGGHAVVGADFLRKHGETPLVCNAVAAHHNAVEAESVYAVLTRAGDAMTAARPGARLETTEIYLRRVEKLEEIARSFPGVEKCYAIQAGREVRVIVEPTKINDADTLCMARDISKKIEENVDYPGQIKVTVVRETRCVEYAR